MTALYFAYGSNLDPEGMANRCPAAVVVGRARLVDWRLAFRGVADVEPKNGDRVEGLLWSCTPRCIRSLDGYEGVAGGFYRKEWLTVQTERGPVKALVYVMNPLPYDRACMPNQYYLDTIVRGYHEFGIPMAKLRAALRRAERQATRKATRWEDDGRKRLRPVDGPKATKRASRRVTEPLVRQAPTATLQDLDSWSDDDLQSLGMSPATIAELRLEQHGFIPGRRIA